MTRSGSGAGSYELRGADSAEAEAQRLREQAAAIWGRENAALLGFGLAAGQRLLEVGCGPGAILRQLARTLERPAFGAEIDATFARRAATSGHAVRADGGALPFADDSFDFVFLRLVLRHAPMREALLIEAARVVRPGGVVCAEDIDEEATTFDPEPGPWLPLKRALAAAAERRGGDPYVGRRLPRLLARAGLVDAKAIILPLTTHDLPPAAFVETVLAPAARVVDADLLAPDAVAAGWAALREWASGAPGFGYALGIMTAARKPDGWRERARS